MIKAEHLTKSFGTLQVLKGISLSVAQGEVVAIVGSSGAGKTTLLEILGTLSHPDGGAVELDGQDVFSLSPRELSRLRNRKLGFVFQFHHLLPEFTALENVCLPALIAGAGRREAEARAQQLLAYLGLSHRTAHKPAALSGGEQQRVAIARAMVNRPALLLADEPSGNLDSRSKQELHALLFRLRAEQGQTIVLVTHDRALADLCDRTITLRDGRVEA